MIGDYALSLEGTYLQEDFGYKIPEVYNCHILLCQDFETPASCS